MEEVEVELVSEDVAVFDAAPEREQAGQLVDLVAAEGGGAAGEQRLGGDVEVAEGDGGGGSEGDAVAGRDGLERGERAGQRALVVRVAGVEHGEGVARRQVG